MTAHSIVGASAAKRWLTCPGSVRLIERLTKLGALEEDTSEYAEDGTFAHRVLEICIAEGDAIADAIWRTTDEMKRTAPTWCEEVVSEVLDALAPLMGGAYWAEHKVTFGRPEHGAFGTLDFASLTDGGAKLTVADLKSGVGLRVSAQKNPQLLCYALGHLAQLSPEQQAKVRLIRLLVLQPRLPGGIVHWDCTVEWLREWERTKLLPGLDTARAGSEELETGEHCRFCPAALFCAARQAEVRRAELFADAAPEQLSDDAILSFLESGARIRKFLALVEAYALKKALAGAPPAGYKLVAGKANRTWRDEAAPILEMLLGDEAYEPRKLRSPAQIEELPGGKALALTYGYAPQGAPTLAPADDTRAAYQRPTAVSMFTPVTGE